MCCVYYTNQTEIQKVELNKYLIDLYSIIFG